jgi:hypothetical protein
MTCWVFVPNFSIRYRTWSRLMPSNCPACVWLPPARSSACTRALSEATRARGNQTRAPRGYQGAEPLLVRRRFGALRASTSVADDHDWQEPAGGEHATESRNGDDPRRELVPLATGTAGVSARKPDSIGGQHATDHQGIEHMCASGAVQAEQAGRLRQCEIESGHLSKFRPHSCTQVMFDG